MSKHILDRVSGRGSGRLVAFAGLRRRLKAQAGPVADRLARRAKGPYNPALRSAAFLKIERGYRA